MQVVEQGASVTVSVPEAGPLLDDLHTDLLRLGGVEVVSSVPRADVPELDAEARALLELMVDGATLGEALALLASSLEHTLGVPGWGTPSRNAAGAEYRYDSADFAAFDIGPGGPAHSRGTTLIHGESIP